MNKQIWRISKTLKQVKLSFLNTCILTGERRVHVLLSHICSSYHRKESASTHCNSWLSTAKILFGVNPEPRWPWAHCTVAQRVQEKQERSCSTVTLRDKADHLIRAGRLNFEMVVCLCFHFIKDNWLEIRRQIEDANLLSPQITRFLKWLNDSIPVFYSLVFAVTGKRNSAFWWQYHTIYFHLLIAKLWYSLQSLNIYSVVLDKKSL